MKSAKNQLSKVANHKGIDHQVKTEPKIWNTSSKVEIIRELSEAEINHEDECLKTKLSKLLDNEELDK